VTPNQFLELAASISVQVALLVLVTAGLSRLVNESGQCRLWAVCHAAILSLLAVALVFPHFRWFQPWSYLSSSRTAELVAVEAPLGRLLLLVWLIGCGASVAVFVFRNVQAARFLRTCQPIPGSERLLPDGAEAGSPSERDKSGQTQNRGAALTFWGRWPRAERSMDVMLLTSSRLAAPFCWQFHRPFIVIPEFIVKDDPEALHFVVRHEWEHLRTGHPLQLFLQRIVETLFWYHPMVWWASRQSDVAREFLCDDAAIESPKQISRYLRALLRIIEQGAGHRALVAALPFSRAGGTIARRARRLAAIAQDSPLRRWEVPERVAVAGLFLAAAFCFFVWIPVDVMASTRSHWSPWPKWSAHVLHDFGIQARDFEIYDRRVDLHELIEYGGTGTSTTIPDGPSISRSLVPTARFSD